MSGETGFSDQPIDGSGDGAAAGALEGMGSVSPFDTKSVDRFHHGAETFKQLATDGQFAVNEDAMQAYTRVCDKYLEGWEQLRPMAAELGYPARMGSSDFARQIAEYNAKVAVGDERSLIPNLDLMYEGFKKMKEGLEIARRNYDETETAASQALNGLDEG
ncbi:hypothetical protein [Haloechinothrix sp. LS1_15]|uniref:hypothetical protein n=1 Tax=Haloechinothrix sp. LS1_15 TaxID=2652248 RepID=UPI00294599A8|nr:hypothetical protein [Haloechinothrix sp. LS1_15]MDV6012298.1 hypothetical protein [Haloechinothrix sp. LS1_15]